MNRMFVYTTALEPVKMDEHLTEIRAFKDRSDERHWLMETVHLWEVGELSSVHDIKDGADIYTPVGTCEDYENAKRRLAELDAQEKEKSPRWLKNKDMFGLAG